MRRWMCVPMMTLCLLLTACGETGKEPEDLRKPYQEMTGCGMEAVVACTQEGALWEATLKCSFVPDGESSVEVLAPEEIAGVKAVISDEEWRLEYEDAVLNAGPLSSESISPALCLPRLMSVLRDGWLLEENPEEWQGIPCCRLTLDQTGEQGGKIVSVLWLRQDNGYPLRGEISVDGEIILTAEFTDFFFYDIIKH